MEILQKILPKDFNGNYCKPLDLKEFNVRAN